MSAFTGEPDPQDVIVANIEPLDDHGDNRVLRVSYTNGAQDDIAEATVRVPKSVGAADKSAAKAVARKVNNLTLPPELRLDLIRTRDAAHGKYRIEGDSDAGYVARETACSPTA